MELAGVDPRGSMLAMENRLLGSNEPWSTFALANSLAGFLVGPLVVMLALGWEGLRCREGRVGRAAALSLAVPPTLVVLVCLILTKSRSAYIGLVVALMVLAWRERRRVRPRTLALAALGGLSVLAVLVAAGGATGQLDRLVLTEATKSLRYRWEYWVGAWGVITEGPRTIWTGIGPGNFGDAYVHHKLPQASEEIKDPHNLVLEVWATAGAWAALALVAALALALWNLLGSTASWGATGAGADNDIAGALLPAPKTPDPPRCVGWVLACAGSGWVLASLLGQLNPFVVFDRWLILGFAWLLAVAFGLPLWRGLSMDAAWLGAAALAVIVNLLAAGGIGIPTVALALWTTIALGLNLRGNRGCGRLHICGGRLPAFGLALIWAALIGSFAGAIGPFWESEAAIAEGKNALYARPPQFDKAQTACERARLADRYSARPWKYQAHLDLLEWEARAPGQMTAAGGRSRSTCSRRPTRRATRRRGPCTTGGR